MSSDTQAVLETRGLTAGYGPQPVIRDVALRVCSGEVVALMGPNGAGKTTTLLSIVGELKLLSGEVLIGGGRTKASLYRHARRGVAYLSEERSAFKSLTTRANLVVAGVKPEDALAYFPELEKRMSVPGGMLSGGEQQMLTLARALCRRPRLLLADELSLGLAPLIVTRLLEAVRAAAKDDGTAVLLVEQHVRKALAYADRAYVMQGGRIALSGTADEMFKQLDQIEESYLTHATRNRSAS